MMNEEISQDDWNPDIRAETVFNKVVVDISDACVKQNIENDNLHDKRARELYKDITVKQIMKEKKQQQQENNDDEMSDDDIPYDIREGVQDQKLFDENLYDPLQDEKYENWVNKSLRVDKNSQIVLSCPFCFAQVSYDSQRYRICCNTQYTNTYRHEVYENQYRSIYVRNCKIDCTRSLQPPDEPKKSGKARAHERAILEKIEKLKKKDIRDLEDDNSQDDNLEFEKDFEQVCPKDFEYFFPVLCKSCNTEIAVYDVEAKVYHFFNVIPSLG